MHFTEEFHLNKSPKLIFTQTHCRHPIFSGAKSKQINKKLKNNNNMKKSRMKRIKKEKREKEKREKEKKKNIRHERKIGKIFRAQNEIWRGQN